jgi:hypothetical protein
MKMKICDDCEISSPPCRCCALFPEDDSDLALIAELVELRVPNRDVPFVMQQEIGADKIRKIANRNPTIGIESLSAHIFGSPNSSDQYANSVLAALTSNWQMDRETVLQKSFWIRAWW